MTPTDEEIKALCERLRSGLNRLGYAFRNKTADALEALTAQVAELRASYAALRDEHSLSVDDMHSTNEAMTELFRRAEAADKRLAEVEAENERNRQGFEFHAGLAEQKHWRAEAAEAHRDRLVSALREIADKRGKCKFCDKKAEGEGGGIVSCERRDCCWIPQEASEIARSTLSGSDVKETAREDGDV